MFFLVIAQVEHATSLKASLLIHVWMVGSVINKESPVHRAILILLSRPVPPVPCSALRADEENDSTRNRNKQNHYTHVADISSSVVCALSALLLPTIRCIYSSSTHPQHILHTFTIFMLSRFTIIIDPSSLSLSLVPC